MRNTQNLKSSQGILGVICGSLLIGIPAISLTSIAMPISQANPRPNTLVETPSSDGNLNNSGADAPTATPITPPLPEQIQSPSATVLPVNGTVNVKLVNQASTTVTYQVIGDTKPRTLSGRSDVTLEGLQTPVTITFDRPDRGLLLVVPQASDQGMLEVTLIETNNLGNDTTAMTIQKNGNVFLN